MKIVEFGEYVEGKSFRMLDERQVRAAAGIMFLAGAIASINGFILQRFEVIPYIAGFLVLNFSIAVFINPKFSPAILLGRIFVRKQSPMPIGAIQKKFAWSLGLVLSTAILILSILTLKDASYFEPVCLLCIVCLILLYLETAFGICVGCKIYFLAIKLKLLPKPTERPNCMGDVCES